MTPRLRYLMKLLVCVCLVARVAAFSLNELPHGDVHLDLLTLNSLCAGDGLTTPLERSAELYARDAADAGHPADQHPPLALLVAALLMPVVGGPYDALRLASLVEGGLLIFLGFLLGRRLYDQDAGWVAAALLATSFLLFDFSGNGSIYTLHALLALLALYFLTLDQRRGWLLCGVTLGLAYLANYQALVLLAGVTLALVASRRFRILLPAGLADLFLLLFGFCLVALPWWLRNWQVFGDPLFSVNPVYARWRLGGEVSIVARDGAALLQVANPTLDGVLENLAASLVVNLRLIGRQLPLWAGPVLVAAVLGGGRLLKRGLARRCAVSLALVLLPLSHLASMAVWPATKFRYFVPLLPLLVLPALVALEERPGRADRLLGWVMVIGLGLLAAETYRRGHSQDALVVLLAIVLLLVPVLLWSARGVLPAALLIVPFCLSQVLLLAASGTGTTYYDGILASDSFGRRGAEEADRFRQLALRTVAVQLVDTGVDSIVADVELKTYALEVGLDLKVVQPAPRGIGRTAGSLGDEEALLVALRRHRVHHALATTAAEREFYAGLSCCGPEVLHLKWIGSEDFVVFRLDP